MRNQSGIFIAHCYQYEPGASTWVLEMEPEGFLARRINGADRSTAELHFRFEANNSAG